MFDTMKSCRSNIKCTKKKSNLYDRVMWIVKNPSGMTIELNLIVYVRII